MGTGNKDQNGGDADNHPEGTRLGHYILGK